MITAEDKTVVVEHVRETIILLCSCARQYYIIILSTNSEILNSIIKYIIIIIIQYSYHFINKFNLYYFIVYLLFYHASRVTVEKYRVTFLSAAPIVGILQHIILS